MGPTEVAGGSYGHAVHIACRFSASITIIGYLSNLVIYLNRSEVSDLLKHL